MAEAIQLIRITIENIFKFIGIALRISVGWVILISVLIYAMPYVVPEGTNLYKGIYSVKALSFNAAILFICIIAFVSCAISWHRFILMNVTPKGLMSLSPIPLILPYLFRCIAIGVIVFVAGTISFFLSSLITPTFHQLIGGSRFAVFYFVPIIFVVLFIHIRLALSLPAIAIGENDYSVIKSWKISKTINGTIMWITFFITLIWFMTNRAKYMLDLNFSFLDGFAYLMFPINIVLDWFYLLFYFGLLTSLYAKVAEDNKI